MSKTVPPPHEPGVIPNWLAGQGVTVVLVGATPAIMTQTTMSVDIDVRLIPKW